MSIIVIKTKRDIIKLSLSDVYFIRSHPNKPHHVQVFTEKESYDCLEKLTSLEGSYPNDLIRCHRNCLVNPSHIKEIHLKDKFVVLGQQEVYRVSFSRRRQQHLLQLWLTEGLE
ncbi:TPA: LytTR family transcriptional regulator DNA-binding domain-containing protein [Streptococcus suis]|uniref:LytR/AlgR family response regulator transcription factor n=1 Tax=Streptococcus suis TaxID=1307 RepID=UPI002A797BC5|nr:LytTR family transcriptional regulator DNA-binding domain-containing protein [Streptococcus suis]